MLRLLHLQRGVRALIELVKVTVAHGSLSPRVSQAEICSHYSCLPILLQPEQGRFPSMVIWALPCFQFVIIVYITVCP